MSPHIDKRSRQNHPCYHELIHSPQHHIKSKHILKCHHAFHNISSNINKCYLLQHVIAHSQHVTTHSHTFRHIPATFTTCHHIVTKRNHAFTHIHRTFAEILIHIHKVTTQFIMQFTNHRHKYTHIHHTLTNLTETHFTHSQHVVGTASSVAKHMKQTHSRHHKFTHSCHLCAKLQPQISQHVDGLP